MYSPRITLAVSGILPNIGFFRSFAGAFGFAVISTALAFAGIMAALYGKRYFKAGVLVKSLMRGAIVALFMFAHFLWEMLGEIGIINPPPYLEPLLEFGFTLGLAYATIGFIRDWQKMGR